MFALETIVEDSLYAVKYDNETDTFENNTFEEDANTKDEFRRLFKNWSDPEYLDAFFTTHQHDLQKEFYNYISIEDAIFDTIDEAEQLEIELLKLAELGKCEQTKTLQTIFKPLDNREKSVINIPSLQACKAKGDWSKSWLRIYAIRINSNMFIVTGGAIKLTEKMDRPHLENELEKLDKVKAFLTEQDIIDENDLIEYIEL